MPKKTIICPECDKSAQPVRQHRIAKRYGTTLTVRNKKIECEDCENFFDETTIKETKQMESASALRPNRRLSFQGNTYQLENYEVQFYSGSNLPLRTGSPVESTSAEMEGIPYTKKDPPLSLEFKDGAPYGKDQILIKNNTKQGKKVFISIITKK